MDCIKCRAELPQNATRCWSCGAAQPDFPTQTAPPPSQPVSPPPPVTPPPPPLPPQAYPPAPPPAYTYNPNQSYNPNYAQPGYAPMYPYPGEHPYRKIGGWLRYLQVAMIISMVFSAISSIRDLFGMIAEMNLLVFVVSLLSLVTTVASHIPTIQLLQRNPKFLKNYHLIFFINLAVSLVSAAIAILGGAEELFALEDIIELGDFFPLLVMFGAVLGVLSSVGFFFLWRMYYTRSVRVRTYLGTDRYMTECPFTKRLTAPPPAVPDEPQPPPQPTYY